MTFFSMDGSTRGWRGRGRGKQRSDLLKRGRCAQLPPSRLRLAPSNHQGHYSNPSFRQRSRGPTSTLFLTQKVDTMQTGSLHRSASLFFGHFVFITHGSGKSSPDSEEAPGCDIRAMIQKWACFLGDQKVSHVRSRKK